MRKIKLILGIIIAILGSFITVVSMVSGISHFAKGLYEDIYSFPVRLSITIENMKTDYLEINAGNNLSIWLKVPDRRIENEDLVFSVYFIKQAGEETVEIKKNFKFGCFRNSSGQGQYYRLGTHYFEENFSGYLSYAIKGTWIAPYEGALVIRRSNPFSLPLKQIIFFAIGIFILIIGICTILKNKPV